MLGLASSAVYSSATTIRLSFTLPSSISLASGPHYKMFLKHVLGKATVKSSLEEPILNRKKLAIGYF
jgi:hypothetical protein